MEFRQDPRPEDRLTLCGKIVGEWTSAGIVLGRLGLTLGLCALLTGCSSDHPADRAPHETKPILTESKNAGVFVLEVVGGEASGGPQLQWPADATRLPDGDVVVVDQLRPGLLFYGPDGKFVRAVGRQGHGPGEFQTPVSIMRCSCDSLYVWDAGLQLMNVYDSSGAFGRSFRISSIPFRMDCTPRGQLAVLDRPQAVVGADPSGRTRRRFVGRLWLSNLEGQEEHVVGNVDVGELRPLGRLTTIALAPGRLYVGTADSAAVSVYAPGTGQALPPIDVPVARRRVTMHEYERYIDRAVSQAPTREGREEGRAKMLQIPRPEWLPYYDAVFADSSARLWVETTFLGDSTTNLQVIGTDDSVLERIEIPGEGTVMEVGMNYVLSMVEDSVSGERRFLVYGLSIPNGRGAAD